jgi:hypothetical protein
MNLASARAAGRVTAVSALLLTAAAVGMPQAGASVASSATGRCYCPSGSGSGSGSGGGPAAVAAPGGYSAVVTSRTITPAGGTIEAVSVPGGRVTLVVPRGAFPAPVQVTLTAPKLAAPDGAHVTGYTIVAGVGIQVQQNGAAYLRAFGKPLTLTVRSSSASASSLVAAWNGTRFVTEPDATVAAGIVTVRFRSDAEPDFAVLSPAVAAAQRIAPARGVAAVRGVAAARRVASERRMAAARRVAAAPAGIPGAARSMTGLLAAVLLALGAGGVVIAVRSSGRA